MKGPQRKRTPTRSPSLPPRITAETTVEDALAFVNARHPDANSFENQRAYVIINMHDRVDDVENVFLHDHIRYRGG